MLYANSFQAVDRALFKESFFDGRFEWELDEGYLYEMFDLIVKHESFLLSAIKTYAPKFQLEKMSLEYTIPLFIWITEMVILDEVIPWKVSINESIEIAKVYWNDSSKKIVNWVLNSVYEDVDKLVEKFKTYTPDITFSFFHKN